MIDVARGAGARYGEEEIDETVAFLEWLREQHFVFLGTRDYAIVDGPDGPALQLVAGTGRGILRAEERSTYVPASRSRGCRRDCASASRAATCC